VILTSLAKISNLKTKREKAEYLDILARQGNDELLRIIFDRDIRFYINIENVFSSEVPSIMIKSQQEQNEELLNILKVLASEELRGKEAEKICSSFASSLDSEEEFSMFLSILENKTRLGIGATDINKYCTEFKIDQFMVMFAKRFDKCNKVNWNQGWCIQPKIDGNRCICVIKNHKIKFYSRTGKDITSLNHIENAIKLLNLNDVVLDGEVENDGSLESTGAIRRKEEQADRAIYTIFGLYPLSQWENKQFTESYISILSHIGDSIPNGNIHIRPIPVYYFTPTNEEEFHELIQEYTDKFLQLGYEGAVLKTLTHFYEPSAGSKRTGSWLKIKPTDSSEGIVLEVLEGKGLSRGEAGKYLIKWLDKTFEIAPGKFKKEQRIEHWINADSYIGKKIEFHITSLTAYGKPREAFAIKFRETD